MTEQKKKFIDVSEVIRSKNPQLYRLLPGFIINYIKRIVHETEVNAFIDEHGHKTSFEFVDAIIENFGVKVEVYGQENIIKTGRCIYASNHPIGGLDAMALLQVLGHYRRDMKFIVNDILLQLNNLKDLFIGVNKHGKNSSQSIADIDALYASEMATLIFPAGLVSRKQGKEIKDLQWKKSFVVKAKKYNSPIVPVYIDGRNSEWFYNLANFRKRIGIAANIEMLYLMDEMYFQRGRTISITFGKPILPQSFSGTDDGKTAEKIKEHVYELKNNRQSFFHE
ncbi:MAG TPA: 1-acyl-sn-glycerol-3-phosphate acyltransferase [Bacteroidia bacterium]|nr:1-acyl-sn-glycerol-3-phosphate acyltransferase [Bacteroidia bacterium]MBP7713091.1 1-acyl-sn-glycerol-3-phosphate acyltransferase [Bacteroidia bacterium]MBP8668323.1 1-acyl-sn-glycerol-3-phosphate acyltransferase [Bacteroidia bacterium]HOZ90905.1 1-acyl-sn-glycerol-3-phosphate acyltransferase [Bacteroidia bacterium]HQW18707.1 1-acyl-sn-glycerol-3-phosphate acyltransferase [Bacteroidia bacterium]